MWTSVPQISLRNTRIRMSFLYIATPAVAHRPLFTDAATDRAGDATAGG